MMEKSDPEYNNNGRKRKTLYSDDFKSLVLEASLSNSLQETARRFEVPQATLAEWQREEGLDTVVCPPASSTRPVPGPATPRISAVTGKYSDEFINEVVNYLKGHTVTEASKLYNVPHSTVFGWKRRLVGSGAEDDREEVLLFAETHTPAEVRRKYNVDQATLSKWRRENELEDAAAKSVAVPGPSQPSESGQTAVKKAERGGPRKAVEPTWETREEIVKYAKKAKNYNVAARKYGVNVDELKQWAHALRGDRKAPKTRKKNIKREPKIIEEYENEEEDEDEDDDNEEEEQGRGESDPEYSCLSEDGKRVKEYSEEVKAAAVRYGLEHGWTAAAVKYGTSSTSVSRWATYMNPKSPWKLKVIMVAKSMGVKDAAKQFKVAKETLQGWIDESAKFCDDMEEEQKDNAEMEDDEESEEEDDDDAERCEVCDESLDLDETMTEHLAIRHLDKEGNCDVCGEAVEDFEDHFTIHQVKVVEFGDGDIIFNSETEDIAEDFEEISFSFKSP